VDPNTLIQQQPPPQQQQPQQIFILPEVPLIIPLSVIPFANYQQNQTEGTSSTTEIPYITEENRIIIKPYITDPGIITCRGQNKTTGTLTLQFPPNTNLQTITEKDVSLECKSLM